MEQSTTILISFKCSNCILFIMFFPLYVGTGILILRGKHRHDHIISLIGAHKTRLAPPPFTEVFVPS